MSRPRRRAQFAIAERIAHLDASTWDSLTFEASVFMQRAFLSAFELTAPENVSPRYALMFIDGQAVAAMVLQVVRVEGRFAVAKDAALGMAQLVDERALVLGNLIAWGETGLSMARSADAAVVWREALDLVDRLRRFEKVEGTVNVAIVKDAAMLDNEIALRSRGYQRAPSGPDMVLPVDAGWRDFGGYLASLASKRRRAVKKVSEDVTGAGYQVRALEVDELAARVDRLEALYGEVWANAEVRPVKLSGGFFVELKRQLKDDCVVTGLLLGDRLDAFSVSLRSRLSDTCIAYYLGFDRVVEAPLYLRLLVSVLEQSFRWGCDYVSLGRTAEEPKARLGAVAGPGALWVKHRAAPFNWALGAILGSLQVPPVVAHRVFKEH